MMGWAEIRIELKGTLGDDLGGLLEDNWAVPLLAGSTISSTLCTKVGKQQFPPTLHFPKC